MTELLAAIDQGTTGSRCFLFDPAGRVAASAYREHGQIYPSPGCVEHDPIEIRDNVSRVVAEALAAAPSGSRVSAVGVTNQRETVVAWDAETGTPAHNAIVWQDTRTEADCRALIESAPGFEERVRARTGLPIRTYFSATKIRWLLAHVPEVARLAENGRLRLGTIDAWVIWNLTGGPSGGAHVTDPTNASRTLLCALDSLEWDAELLDRFGVPKGGRSLPRIVPSIPSEPYGWTDPAGPFRARLPVCGDLGDQQAALFGQGCVAPGAAKTTYGTGAFLLQHAGAAPPVSRHGLLATAAAAPEGERAYALEGSVADAGSAVQWLRDNVKLVGSAAESEAVARSVPDSGGAVFVPAFSGLYAPHWDMTARGTILGLTRFSTAAHLVRATLEAIAFQCADVIEAMSKDSGRAPAELRVDGGAAANDLLMQLQADVLGIPVLRPAMLETTALGAALAAGIASGAIGFDDAVNRPRSFRAFEPAWDDARRGEALERWRRAVDRARGWLAS
jgi:glycerol kinase